MDKVLGGALIGDSMKCELVSAEMRSVQTVMFLQQGETMIRNVVVGASIAAMLVTSVPAVAAESPTGFIATGVLTDKAGRGSAGLVYAVAWPGEDLLRTLEPGDVIATPTVGSTTADRSGRFAVAIDGAAVPQTHRRRDGGLNLLLVGTDGSNEGMTFQSTAGPAELSPELARYREETIPAVTLAMTLRLSPAKRTELAGSMKSSGPTPNAAPPPATYPCHGWSLVDSSLVWVSMGQSYSGPATNFAVLEQSNSVTAGTAVSATAAYGSWSVSGSQTLTVGNTKTYTESLTDRDFQSEFQYGRWKATCGSYDRYAFTPSFGTGGDRTVGATNFPAKNNCSSISAGLWSRSSSSGSAYSESVGVKADTLLGLNLGVTHNYSSSSGTKFTLNYRNSSTVTICGDTNFPALASKPRI